MKNTLSPTRLLSRRGNALVATLIISVTVGLALNLSSERLQGLQVLAAADHAKFQARIAAESVAAIVEGRLRERGAEDTAFLNRDIASGSGTNYGSALEIPGFANTASASPQGLRIGNCIVWWRVEPVKVWSETVKSLSDVPVGKYAINPNLDDRNSELDIQYKEAIQNDPGLFKDNDRNFLFRIVTEAYALTDPGYVYDSKNPDNNPRNKPQLRSATAQATRVVQYTLVNLFEYAIFYAAQGTTGDLEFWQGTGMAVKGRVHSNGAIYIGGGGQAYMSKAYHSAASGNGGLAIGSAEEPTQVTGVDGLYRMRKPANFVSVMNGDHPSAYTNPYLVPMSGLIGELDLNGDKATDIRHTINGVPFTSANDSRSTDVNNALITEFGRRVTDKYTGAKIVESLANVPKFQGRPLEPELLGGFGNRLYGHWTKDANTLTIADISIRKDHPKFDDTLDHQGAALYYAENPLLAQKVPKLTYIPAESYLPANPVAASVTAYNLPMYWQDAKMEKIDVNPPATVPEKFLQQDIDTQAGFRTGTRTILLNNQLAIDTKANTTGLVIRERPAVVNSVAITYPANPFPAIGGFPDSPTIAQRTALAGYLKAQYQVRFYGEDITNTFFDDLTNAGDPRLPECTTRAQAIVTEDFIVNRREANFMKMFFGENENAYTVNLITLNLRRVQDFIAYTPMKSLHTKFVTLGLEGNMKKYFNGVIYVHRTRRSQTYHPLERPYWLFNTNARADFDPPAQQALPAAIRPGEREKDGPIEIAHSGVRVRGGLVTDGALRNHMASVSWQHDTNSDGIPDVNPLGTSKMTVITPNPMYLWGDINTTPISDGTKPQRPPVAIFADSMTLLSANWRDTSVATYGSGVPAATHTSYVTSFVINNQPCREWNAVSEGSGAVANLCRFLENWGNGGSWPYPLPGMSEYPSGMPRPTTYGNQVVYTFLGSLVVINEQRYGRGVLGAGKTNLNDTSFYSPPFRNLAYNTDLKLAAGQPPESLRALETTRVVSLVNMFEN
jgi:hypothetical protein